MIINAYIGVIGSGKDYEANKCDKQYGFADALLEDIWIMIGWKPKNKEEYEKFKNTLFQPVDFGALKNINPPPCFTGRDLLQRYGTQLRRKENDNHWVDKLLEKIFENIGENKTIGITDCRFPNEVKGLIDFVEKYPIYELNFIHCDFKSNRYNDTNEHESEKMAQDILKECKKDSFEINNYLLNKYGKKKN